AGMAERFLGGDHIATGTPECCVCPVCKGIAALRNPDPEFAARVASGASDLAVGLTTILRAVNSVTQDARPKPPPPRAPEGRPPGRRTGRPPTRPGRPSRRIPAAGRRPRRRYRPVRSPRKRSRKHRRRMRADPAELARMAESLW